MIDKLIALGLCVLTQAVSRAQPAENFQQRVDYDIDVRLDPERHELDTRGTLVYHNQSPDPLDSIPLQLWANAYARRDSDFGKQQRRMGSADFYFADQEDRGGYRALAISGEALASTRVVHPELHIAYPINPLQPGDSIAIDFTYTLRVPKTFSRMGRAGTHYQITQWYPKPALYDDEGWHPMPYLDFGEYYNDFGDYRVRVTVPENGIVGATGELVNQGGLSARRARLLATETDTARIDTLAYGAGSITFEYVAESVTDFAWFADSKFRVARAEAQLTDRTIPAFAYYLADGAEQWRKAAGLIARAAAFADSLVGPYPHPQISAVYAELGVGGGMEYPMITVIGPTGSPTDLDRVLAHEAFHNWFALHVATNERAHPWMDEGLTTWLEGRYMQRYHDTDFELSSQLPSFLTRASRYTGASLLHAVLAKASRQPAVDTHSDNSSGLGYGYSAYTQPGANFELLERNLGRHRFERQIRDYYAKWGGRHPGPRDLEGALDFEGAHLPFEDSFLGRELPDYQILSARYDATGLLALELENRSNVAGPLLLSTRVDTGDYRPLVSLPGFTGARTYQLSTTGTATAVAIDPDLLTNEADRTGNYRRVGGGSLRPVALAVLPKVGDPERHNLGLAPVLTFNEADRFNLGVGFHNYTADVGALRYFLAPQVSTRGGQFGGIGRVAYSFYESNGRWRELELSATGRRYGYDYNDSYDVNPRYSHLTLGAELLLASDFGLRDDHRLGLRGHLIGQEFITGIDIETGEFSREGRRYAVAQLDYSYRRSDPITPWSTAVTFEAGEAYGRLSAKLNYGLRYNAAGSRVDFRAFAGAFVFRDRPEFRAVLLPNGITGFGRDQNDYLFEENLVNRAEASNQYFVRDGSLTLPFILPQASSESWLTSLSVSVDAPLKVPFFDVSLYGDLAIYPDERPGRSGIVGPSTAGFRVSLPLGIASVSFPIYNSSFVRESLVFTRVDPKYRERIALRVDLSQLDVDEFFRRLRG